MEIIQQLKFRNAPTEEQVDRIRKAVEDKRTVSSISTQMGKSWHWVVRVAKAYGIPLDQSYYLPKKRERVIIGKEGIFNVHANENWIV